MILTAEKQGLLEAYGLEPSDLMYCDLVISGWGKIEAAFFAYGLAYEDQTRIRKFLHDHVIRVSGVERYIDERKRSLTDNLGKRMARQAAREEREAREFERRVKTEVDARLRELMGDKPTDKLSKEDLGRLYTSIINDPSADSKTKMDAAKNYTALYQINKTEEKEEDNRINFYLPLTCNKCSIHKAYMASRQRVATEEEAIEGEYEEITE